MSPPTKLAFPRGGENIFPKEIEDVLYTHPDVLEAAVVGLEIADLLQHCRASLARFKVPREIHLQPSLPKNAVGKLMKAQLVS